MLLAKGIGIVQYEIGKSQNNSGTIVYLNKIDLK